MYWWDNWLDNANLVDILGIDAFIISNFDLKVCDVISSDRCQDVTKIQRLVTKEDIVQKIIGLPLSHIETEDTISWGFTSSGQFSTKIATWAAHKTCEYNDTRWTFN